jgi:transcriptional regulator with XRE-family HTH domain
MARVIPFEVAESGRGDDSGGQQMPIGERIKTLRKETGWSQRELADRIGADARQVSRYENGRITPSLDAATRLAEALNVSLDHLVFDDVPRRPLHAPENILGDRLATVAELDPDELGVLASVIDGLVTKKRLRTITGGTT